MNTSPIPCLEDRDHNTQCECALCNPTDPEHHRFAVVTRTEGEYIVIDGRVCTRWGAPVSGDEDAGFRLHENIVRPYEDGAIPGSDIAKWLGNTMFPLQANIFRPADAVDLYRALKSRC